MNAIFNLSIVTILALATACKPPAAGTGSQAKADDTTRATMPILLATSDTPGQHYLYVTVPEGSVSTLRLCTTGTKEACAADPTQPTLTPIQVVNGMSFYASTSLDFAENTPIHLVGLDDTTVVQSRSFRLMRSNKTLTVVSPKEHQVFQRDTIDKGKVVVEVSLDGLTDGRYVQARVIGTALSNTAKAPGIWREGEVAPGATTAKVTVPSPAGGWFSVEVVLLDETRSRLLGHATIKAVGVGEVFIVAGQSNSTNCGWGPQRSNSDFLVTTDGDIWERKDDPQIGTHDASLCNKDNGHGGSNWPITGAILVKKYRVPVAFASTGYGGTAIKEWSPTAPSGPAGDDKNMSLFNYTARRAEQLRPGGIRAVLWHQGENDTKDKTTRADYTTGMTALIKGVREKSGSDTPWLIAVTSWCPANPSYGAGWAGDVSSEVTGAQEGLVADRAVTELYAGPSSDDIKERGTTALPQDCHFNEAGLKILGERWAEKIKVFLDAKLNR